MIVHLPVALAALLPLAAAAALLAWWRGWLPGRRLWLGVVVLQATLTLGAVVALRTGQSEEDRVERVVPEAAIERHEEAAETFLATAAAALVLATLAAAVPRDALRRTVAVFALAAMGVTLAMAYRTGKAGGELVYRHGAGAAYAPAGPAATPLRGGDD
jgi:uncharacterized membrane protein